MMQLGSIESWKGPGEQMSKTKTKGQSSISSRKLLKSLIMKRAKEYYHLLFIEKASNPKEVFRIANALIARNDISPLPEYSSLTELDNGFNNFFVDKISSIRDNIINTHFNGIQPTPVEPVSELDFPEMDSFHHISKKSVEELWAGSYAHYSTQINGWSDHPSDNMHHQCIFAVRWIFWKFEECTSQTIDKENGIGTFLSIFQPSQQLVICF